MDFENLPFTELEVILTCIICMLIVFFVRRYLSFERTDFTNTGESKVHKDDVKEQTTLSREPIQIQELVEGKGKLQTRSKNATDPVMEPQCSSQQASIISQQTIAVAEDAGTDIDRATLRKSFFITLLRKLGLNSKEKINVSDGMQVSSVHEAERENDSIIENFVAKLSAYDYRVQQINIKIPMENLEDNEGYNSEDWDDFETEEEKGSTDKTGYSSRDIFYAIYNCLDPFFLQEVLMKLSACQLAVPVLLPNTTGNNARFLLWGLRRIVKSWCNDKKSSSIQEETIVSHEMLTVTALRIGKVPLSKSNILNKLLGPTQGNDDHAFFMSFEQDSSPTTLSNGTVESIWFLPDNEIGHISSPFALLNLRGDYLEHTNQAKFAIEMSFVTIVFIDAKQSKAYKKLIENIRLTSHIIVVRCKNTLQRKDRTNARRTFYDEAHQLTQIFTDGMSALEISAEISKVIENLIKTKKLKVSSLEKATDLAKASNFEVDEDDEDCIAAKQLAFEVFSEIKTLSPYEYKRKYFPLQKLWKEWSDNDKVKTWSSTDNLETDIANHESKQNQLRLAQAQVNVSLHLKKIFDFMLQGNRRRRGFLFSWLRIYLNDIAAYFLKPLTTELMTMSSKRRDLSTKINELEIRTPYSTSMSKTHSQDLTQLKQQEADIAESEQKLINQFDENSFGIEHYMREFGQLVESYHYTKKHTENSFTYIRNLPFVAADMLLNGEPLEILDGDVSHVPLVWLKEVLVALINIIKKDATVYVISVLGIQNSGKSTLLNSMFGVRFAASAGRCTRGVFMQVLPVEAKARNTLNCDYLVIVDTEGLRAPEKSLSSYTHQDNELATFALCISNLTLINIGGQTMGENMTDVLQIAAHAFVRMTQVNLRPECRIIQQFVADVTADQKNESAMQTIIMKLDEAAREAAKNEGKEHLYRQYSDVFSVQNYNTDVKNVQYIPSLWRGFMGAPDYQYSLRVQQLKSTILQSIEKKNQSPLTIKEFHQRISDVWNAVKKEDFVFSFQNTKEVSLYQEIKSFYRNLILPIRQEVIEMELSARSSIENATPENIYGITEKSLNEIRTVLMLRCKDVHEKITFKCREKRYESVRKYSMYFETDLQVLQGRAESSVSSTFSRLAAITKSAHTKDSVLQSLSAEIRDKFANFAETLRRQTEELLSGGSDTDNVNLIINNEFEKQWTLMIKDLHERYPLRSLQEITEEIRDKISRNINDVVQNSVLSMEAFKMLKGNMSLYSCQESEILNEDIEHLKLLYCSINDTSEKKFKKLCQELKELATDVTEFETNVPIALEKIKAYMNTTDVLVNKKFIVFFICCQILMQAHRSQQMCEWQTVLVMDSELFEICTKLKILQKYEIKPVLIQYVFEALPESKRNDKLKSELEELTEKMSNRENEKQYVGLWEMLKQTAHWLDNPGKVLDDLDILIKSELSKCIKANHGKCTRKVIESFATVLVAQCLDKKVPSKDKEAALKYYFKVAEMKFMTANFNIISTYIHSGDYQIKFAQPLKYCSLQKKLDFLLTSMKGTFPLGYLLFLQKELQTEDIFKVEVLPKAFSMLKKMDFRFIKLLQMKNKQDFECVLRVTQNVKSSILTTAKPKSTFYAASFAQHVQDIVDQTDHKLPNNVRAAAIIHVGAWSLPIYARRQYDFERDKNVAVLIETDKKQFEKEFKSLASNCQDEIIAEMFVDIIECALKDGLMNILYPILYLSILNDHSEFRNKKKFIGSVMKNLFETDNISGISQFLSNFASYSTFWILELVAQKMQNNRLWLDNHVTECVKSLADSTKLTILELFEEFEKTSGESLSEMLDTFAIKFKDNTKLTCNTGDIEKLKRYRNVKDIQEFLSKCDELLDHLKEKLQNHFESPPLNDKEGIKSWLLNSLPKRIHVDLFDSFKGCDEQCPFCGTVCDEDLSEHPKHESLCHFPSGLTGWYFSRSDKLNTFICNSAVESSLRYQTRHGDPEFRPFKEYETDFPNWKIRGIESSELYLFWKHLFATHNEKFAEIHGLQKADIPPSWFEIEEQTALESLSEIYLLRH